MQLSATTCVAFAVVSAQDTLCAPLFHRIVPQGKMMKCGLNFNGRRRTQVAETTTSRKEDEVDCELRPGGMLVQKRSDDSETPPTLPNLRIRVVHGADRYEILTNFQSNFGELKKLIAANAGLQPSEQRLIFRGKERGSGDYFDTCGMKDRSTVVLIEDPASVRRRMIEKRRRLKIQAAHRLIDDVSGEVGRLAEQVYLIEKSVANGKKVAELQITTLLEMLMRQAIKLDGIPTKGDAQACVKKDSQEKKVQKCVESLDVLKISNANQRNAATAASTPHATPWQLFD